MLSAAVSSFTPEQVRQRKIIKKGLNLTILVCGKSGSGKSTFINTLCDRLMFNSKKHVIETFDDAELKLRIDTHHIEVNEPNSTPISLKVVLTPNFGVGIDNSDSAAMIAEFLEEQFDAILQEECRIKRNPRSSDNRVHVALYFIKPTGRGLTEIDIETMKTIGSRVNVIPILSKADTLTESEIIQNKKIIMRQIKENQIPIFDFAPTDNGEAYDDDDLQELLTLKEMLPFAIVGSNNVDKDDLHVREYPWGTFTVEDPELCDFIALKTVLFGSHLQEFKDITHSVLYEKYRTDRLSGKSATDISGKRKHSLDPQMTQTKLESEINEYDEKLGSALVGV